MKTPVFLFGDQTPCLSFSRLFCAGRIKLVWAEGCCCSVSCQQTKTSRGWKSFCIRTKTAGGTSADFISDPIGCEGSINLQEQHLIQQHVKKIQLINYFNQKTNFSIRRDRAFSKHRIIRVTELNKKSEMENKTYILKWWKNTEQKSIKCSYL